MFQASETQQNHFPVDHEVKRSKMGIYVDLDADVLHDIRLRVAGVVVFLARILAVV